MMLTPEEYRQVALLLFALLLAVSGAYMLSPVGECDSCAHCRRGRLAKDDPTCPLHKVPRSECAAQHG